MAVFPMPSIVRLSNFTSIGAEQARMFHNPDAEHMLGAVRRALALSLNSTVSRFSLEGASNPGRRDDALQPQARRRRLIS